MCIKAVEEDQWQLGDATDRLKTQEMCDAAVMENPCTLEFVPDHFKTQEMRDDASVEDTFLCNIFPISL